jgi:hypothetical protein
VAIRVAIFLTPLRDARFCAAMERAIERGLERRDACASDTAVADSGRCTSPRRRALGMKSPFAPTDASGV